VFDADKLRWVNAHLLHHATGAQLEAWGGAFLPAEARALDPARRAKLLEAVRGNLATLADLPGELAPFVADRLEFEPAAREALAGERAAELCAALASALAGLAPWSGEQVKSAVQSLGRSAGLKGRDLFQPVRAALTGRTHGPELPLVAELLGRDRCVERLRAGAGLAAKPK
jgi:nondiscriminating glutamyl-tRNA synthetase